MPRWHSTVAIRRGPRRRRPAPRRPEWGIRPERNRRLHPRAGRRASSAGCDIELLGKSFRLVTFDDRGHGIRILAADRYTMELWANRSARASRRSGRHRAPNLVAGHGRLRRRGSSSARMARTVSAPSTSLAVLFRQAPAFDEIAEDSKNVEGVLAGPATSIGAMPTFLRRCTASSLSNDAWSAAVRRRKHGRSGDPRMLPRGRSTPTTCSAPSPCPCRCHTAAKTRSFFLRWRNTSPRPRHGQLADDAVVHMPFWEDHERLNRELNKHCCREPGATA